MRIFLDGARIQNRQFRRADQHATLHLPASL